MKEPRTVFAAVIAFTDKPTKDGRTLATPEGFLCPVRRPLVPVLWTTRNRGTHRVGEIEKSYVVDRRLIVFGKLHPTPEGREAATLIRDHGWGFEIDVQSGDPVFDLDPALDPVGTDQHPEITFKNWELFAVWLGIDPCWDLPPVQMEEVRR